MKRTTSKMLGLALVALGLAAAPFVMAEPPAADGKGQRAEFKKQRKAMFKAKRGELLRKELGIADGKATQIETTLDSYRKQMRGIKKQNRQLMKKVKALLAEDSNDNQAYEYNLRALKYNKVQVDKIKQARQDFLSKQLTPKQQAIMMMKHKQMRKQMKRFKRGKMGRRGGGPAGF